MINQRHSKRGKTIRSLTCKAELKLKRKQERDTLFGRQQPQGSPARKSEITSQGWPFSIYFISFLLLFPGNTKLQLIWNLLTNAAYNTDYLYSYFIWSNYSPVILLVLKVFLMVVLVFTSKVINLHSLPKARGMLCEWQPCLQRTRKDLAAAPKCQTT
jgi:hypothetical protein